MREVLFEAAAFEDMQHWAKNDLKLLKKVIELLGDIQKTPFAGIGKPESLKHQYKGFWSRRINDEHRLVYTVGDTEIVVVSCRYHYT